MVSAVDLFDEGATHLVSFDQSSPHFWQCYRCEKTTQNIDTEYEPIEGYEKKGVVKCLNCGYIEVVHFHHTDMKRVHEQITTDRENVNAIDMQLFFYYTGKHKVKAVLEQGGVIVDVYREPKQQHPDFDSEKHGTIPSLSEACNKTGHQDHKAFHMMAVPQKNTP